MIFKSLGRKTASFSDLYDYINGETKALGDGIVWNLSTFDIGDRQLILSDFYENTTYLRTRKNGNVLYHEILSLPRSPEDDLDTLKNAIHDMAVYWLEARACDQLAYGRVHYEVHNIHLHLMVSANVMGGDRRTLSKFEFAKVEKDCELYISQRYPELSHRMLHQRSPQQKRLSIKEQVRLTLEAILAEEITHQTPPLRTRIQEAGYELTLRPPASHSVKLPSGMSYRFKRFGLLERLLDVLEVERTIAHRQSELQQHIIRVTPLQDHAIGEAPPR